MTGSTLRYSVYFKPVRQPGKPETPGRAHHGLLYITLPDGFCRVYKLLGFAAVSWLGQNLAGARATGNCLEL